MNAKQRAEYNARAGIRPDTKPEPCNSSPSVGHAWSFCRRDIKNPPHIPLGCKCNCGAVRWWGPLRHIRRLYDDNLFMYGFWWGCFVAWFLIGGLFIIGAIQITAKW